jgi:hypothetical protein
MPKFPPYSFDATIIFIGLFLIYTKFCLTPYRLVVKAHFPLCFSFPPFLGSNKNLEVYILLKYWCKSKSWSYETKNLSSLFHNSALPPFKSFSFWGTQEIQRGPHWEWPIFIIDSSGFHVHYLSHFQLNKTSLLILRKYCHNMYISWKPVLSSSFCNLSPTLRLVKFLRCEFHL